MNGSNDYPVVVKSYELSVWYLKKLATLPKNHRYSLGEAIQKELIALLLNLTEAIYTKDKIGLLKNANLAIEKIRILTRLLKDLSILSHKNYFFVVESLGEVGAMTGGWLKQCMHKSAH
ncbi:MAG: diversity-generating retroelement protein Avd [Campylobacterota bacterium]|nr:diversity-generating retroelement protein Avd [Campylobacterota bacterium]